MKQKLIQRVKPPLSVWYNIRNQIINENCTKQKDIIELPRKTHYETIMSYMTEKQIFEGINQRIAKIFSKSRGNFVVSNSVDAFKKNQVATRYGILRQINNWVKKDYRSHILHGGLSLFDPAFVGAIPPPVPTMSLADLKAYYDCEDTGTPIVNQATAIGSTDSLGTAADGVEFGTPEYSQTGKIGNAIKAVRTTEGWSLGTSVTQFKFLTGSALLSTINFWFKSGDINQGNGFIFSSFTGAGDTGINISMPESGTLRQMAVEIRQNGVAKSGGIMGDWTDDTNFRMMTYTRKDDATTDNLEVFIDNVSEGTVDETSHSDNFDHTSGLNLAANADESSGLSYTLDDPSIWGRVLTTSERGGLFNGGSGATPDNAVPT